MCLQTHKHLEVSIYILTDVHYVYNRSISPICNHLEVSHQSINTSESPFMFLTNVSYFHNLRSEFPCIVQFIGLILCMVGPVRQCEQFVEVVCSFAMLCSVIFFICF